MPRRVNRRAPGSEAGVMRSDREGMADRSALAIGAHPDDIEFYMAGTLLLLKQAGFEIHYLNVSSGSCGSMELSAARTRVVRAREARRASELLGATFHAGFADDLEIVYSVDLLRKVASAVREIGPQIILTHSPQDYMEDHTNTCRLVVSAAFARGMPNFKTIPPRAAIRGEVTVYHAMPHGLRDPLGQPVLAQGFVDTTLVHGQKEEALAAHASQKEWLDATQGMGSYVKTMSDFSREVGAMGGFEHGEGWRRHWHLGFCSRDADPLREWLGERYRANPKWR